ncbi:unnamed protein product [Dibothriocephalus latus]|uniref:Uncharacterized protein n=1 Tax=Dibothriocephalus latus TaxID=60516 RepID=A0A3P6UE13_DIBLA|nr:unnamed protein product [Dibothriocephalus latus]
MKMQCRLADLYVILSVTIVCWILPNFALKSGELPTLLLTNMLTVADIFNLLNCFDEPLAPIRSIWSTVICVWPASLLHRFCNNITSLVDISTEADDGWDDSESHSSASLDSRSDYSGSDSLGSDSRSWSEYVEETNNQNFLVRGSSNIDTCQSNSSPLEECTSSLFSVIVDSGDLPFLCVRCYLLSRVNRYNPQIYFFAAKNTLFIVVERLFTVLPYLCCQFDGTFFLMSTPFFEFKKIMTFWSFILLHVVFNNISSVEGIALPDVESLLNSDDVESGQWDAKYNYSTSTASVSAFSESASGSASGS